MNDDDKNALAAIGYEVQTANGDHSITSDNVLLCSETGRVIAVFYNDYDLNDIAEALIGAVGGNQ